MSRCPTLAQSTASRVNYLRRHIKGFFTHLHNVAAAEKLVLPKWRIDAIENWLESEIRQAQAVQARRAFRATRRKK